MRAALAHDDLLDEPSVARSLRRGDHAALTEVFRHYADDVATLARFGFTFEQEGTVRVPGADLEDERELVQETFAKAFAEKARHAYDGLQPYRPYLLRITKNLMIDRHRAKLRTARLPPDAGEGEADAPEDLDWRTQRQATLAYLATLDEETRRIVALRFEDELSQDEVARRVGCTRRKVRSVEDRVQTELRKWLAEHGVSESRKNLGRTS